MSSSVPLYENTDIQKIENVFLEMLQRQDKVNGRVSVDWVDKAVSGEWDYLFAGAEELVELAKCIPVHGRIGYKWWSKGQDLTAANLNIIMELVDAWHFFMSYDLSAANMTALAAYYKERYIAAAKISSHESKNLKSRGAMNLIKQLISQCMEGSFSAYSFFHLCLRLDVDYKTLYSVYVAKATLNTFRQDKGYKEGTYIKKWTMKDTAKNIFVETEDNHFLMCWLMNKLKHQENEVTDIEILGWLETTYREVLLHRN